MPIDVRGAHQHREDDHVNQALDELAVVHRAHAGNQPQNRGRQPGWGRPNGACTKGRCTLCHAVQHGSQRICPPAALRTQPAQSALPQFWQYAVAFTPLWFTQSMVCPFPPLHHDSDSRVATPGSHHPYIAAEIRKPAT